MRLLPFFLLASSGCAALDLYLINASTRKPSNVAVYFTVDRSNGDPVPGLVAENFRIYEDDKPVSALESKQTILNPEVAAVHYTLLLVDMSGSITAAGQLPALQAAAQAFTSRVEKYQRVGVYAFDGSPSLMPVVPLSSEGGAAAGIERLSGLHPKDPSTNLNGAVVQALQVLKQALDKASQPLKFGTLVVFTDGTDHAARVSQGEMLKAVDAATFDIFAIGVGSEIDKSELGRIGRTGTVLETDSAKVKQAFESIAQKIEGFTQRFYLLSYCSPARAHVHGVKIEAITPDGASGRLTHSFDANGFQPNCDPKTPPLFDTSLRSSAPHRKR